MSNRSHSEVRSIAHPPCVSRDASLKLPPSAFDCRKETTTAAAMIAANRRCCLTVSLPSRRHSRANVCFLPFYVRITANLTVTSRPRSRKMGSPILGSADSIFLFFPGIVWKRLTRSSLSSAREAGGGPRSRSRRSVENLASVAVENYTLDLWKKDGSPSTAAKSDCTVPVTKCSGVGN